MDIAYPLNWKRMECSLHHASFALVIILRIEHSPGVHVPLSCYLGVWKLVNRWKICWFLQNPLITAYTSIFDESIGFVLSSFVWMVFLYAQSKVKTKIFTNQEGTLNLTRNEWPITYLTSEAEKWLLDVQYHFTLKRPFFLSFPKVLWTRNAYEQISTCNNNNMRKLSCDI